MSMDDLLRVVSSFDGVLDVAPVEGGDSPPLAWGDHFFYYAPNGQIPPRQQPYATIVTKNYPDDSRSELDAPDRWRVNIRVGADRFLALIGDTTRLSERVWDYAATDVLLPHPVYRRQGWVSIVNPGPRTVEVAASLLREAHEAARLRFLRGASDGS
ncbi:DUF6194 family protein [Gordonia aichiensis]|nr:DUF6194 family protein [Gordonia aichiensis]